MRVVGAQASSSEKQTAQSRRRAGRVMSGVGLLLCAGALVACSSTPSTGTTASSTPSSAVAATSPAASSPTGSYPADKQQLCQSRDQLKKSIMALTNPALLTGGADGIKSALTQVETDLQGLVVAGKQDYQPQIDALQSSLKSVETAVGQLGNGGGAQNLLSVGTAVTATGSAASTLFTELTTACGS